MFDLSYYQSQLSIVDAQQQCHFWKKLIFSHYTPRLPFSFWSLFESGTSIWRVFKTVYEPTLILAV